MSCEGETSHQECDRASLCGKNEGMGSLWEALLTSGGSCVQAHCNSEAGSWAKAARKVLEFSRSYNELLHLLGMNIPVNTLAALCW